jgi:uncharacterized membrane protein
MTNRTSVLAAACAGAACMYFLDPDKGARRRARFEDAATHATKLARRGLRKSARDVRHRLSGTVATVQSVWWHKGADDPVLLERVRSALGRWTSHPHAIGVVVSNRAVTASGPILEREAASLIRAVGKVDGVREVRDRLERHAQADNVPSLQGGRQPVGKPPDIWQTNWAPATRLAAGIAGTVLIGAGTSRRDRAGTAAAALGTALLGRALINVPLNHLAGLTGSRGLVDVQKTITIEAPVRDVYARWTAYQEFPRIMSRVLDVKKIDGAVGKSHWRVAGPAGLPLDFDAEITHVIPNQLLAWRTLPGAAVAHGGIVRFDLVDANRTRVQIHMSYNPPAGWIGHGLAKLLGADPKRGMDDDLVRLKALIEGGPALRSRAGAATNSPMRSAE